MRANFLTTLFPLCALIKLCVNQLNSNLAGPKPFNYAAGPPAAAPKSPAAYVAAPAPAWSKPQQQPQPQHQQPQAYVAPAPPQNYGAATLPRPAAQNAPGEYVREERRAGDIPAM